MDSTTGHDMTQQTHGRSWDYALLLTVGGLMLFLNLGSASLWDLDEGRNATAAYEMFESGNWIVPTFNGKLREHKPALLYWLQALAYLTFGVNEFAARLPSAVAAMATVAVASELARAMFGRATGLLSAFALATMPMLCGAGRFANPDALLNLFTAANLAVFWFTTRRPAGTGFVLMGVTAGLGALAKGPVGVILPAATAILFLILERRWALLFHRRWLLTAFSFCLTALPWYIWVAVETRGEFVRQFFFKHNISRGLVAMEAHDGFFGYYGVVWILGALPWSIFLFTSLWMAIFSAVREPWSRCRSAWERSHDMEAEVSRRNGFDTASNYRFLLIWLAAFFTFYGIAATKLPNYILPVTLPTAILVGRFLYRWREGKIGVPLRLMLSGVASMMLMGLVVFVIFFASSGEQFGPIFAGAEMLQLHWWSLTGLAIVALAVGCWRFARAGQNHRFVVTLGASAIVFTGMLGSFGLALVNPIKAPQLLLEDVGLISQHADVRLAGWDVEHLPSLNFYSQRMIEDLSDEHEIKELLGSRLTAYVFMPEKHWRRIAPALNGSVRVVGRRQDMFKRSGLVVVTNQ